MQLACREQNDLIFNKNQEALLNLKQNKWVSLLQSKLRTLPVSCERMSLPLSQDLRITCPMITGGLLLEGRQEGNTDSRFLGVQEGLGTSLSLTLPHTRHCHPAGSIPPHITPLPP